MVDGVTLAFAGRTLLERTEFRLVAGRRYALLGRNGVGKSTLLRRIAAGALPGFPPHLRVAYVAQETRAPSTDDLPVDAMVASAGQRRRGALEAERDELEAALVEQNDDADEVAAAAERLWSRGGAGGVRDGSHPRRGQGVVEGRTRIQQSAPDDAGSLTQRRLARARGPRSRASREV